jgi:hypothetical protein
MPMKRFHDQPTNNFFFTFAIVTSMKVIRTGRASFAPVAGHGRVSLEDHVRWSAISSTSAQDASESDISTVLQSSLPCPTIQGDKIVNYSD